jgi:NAD(P)-dependent dehydrogenase (short-subunit alcohol dehydrogenase family)
MEGPKPATEEIPTEEGGYQRYKAAGKLEGKKAVITGGDSGKGFVERTRSNLLIISSGIGRAVAVLFAMEGADSLINYLPEEEKDAQETKRLVEKYGRKCHLLPADIKSKENCQKVVDTAMSDMSAINILVNNNAAYRSYLLLRNLLSVTF